MKKYWLSVEPDTRGLPWVFGPTSPQFSIGSGVDLVGLIRSTALSFSLSTLYHCRRDNGPISELPTETKLTARACHYHRPEICYEFDMQKTKYSTMIPEGG